MANAANLKFPLASSYNTRNNLGFTQAISNAGDQRKVNFIYEVTQNPITGKATLKLVKRPGAAVFGLSHGDTDQTSYLASDEQTEVWVFSTRNNDIRVSDSATTTVIDTEAGYTPEYVGESLISGVKNTILQIKNSSLAQKVYFSANDIATWTEITDAQFPANGANGLSGQMVFIDGWALALERFTNRIYNSDLNSLSAWQAQNYITKQIKSDHANGLAKYKKQIIAFGANTMEVFENVGNPIGSPLKARPELAHDSVGIALQTQGRRHYYTTAEGMMFFLGNPPGLYMWNGVEAAKVSNFAIDKILNERDLAGQLYGVFRVKVNGLWYIAIALDAATASTQRWLMYSIKWNEWFEWTSTVFSPAGVAATRQLFVGVSNKDRLYTIDLSNWTDADGVTYQALTQFKLPHDENSVRKFMSMCGVEGDTNTSATSLSVQFSDDDGQTWSTARTVDMTKPKKVLHRCGSYFGRDVRLSYTGANSLGLRTFFANVQSGQS